MQRLRYVVLHHTGIPEPHFDLMIENSPGSELMTWRCADWPPKPGQSYTRIADHRREYLELQGPLSGSRGSVQRVVEGTCVTTATPTHLQVELSAEFSPDFFIVLPITAGL